MPQFERDPANPDRPFFNTAVGAKTTDKQGNKIMNIRDPFLNKNVRTKETREEKTKRLAKLSSLSRKLMDKNK